MEMNIELSTWDNLSCGKMTWASQLGGIPAGIIGLAVVHIVLLLKCRLGQYTDIALLVSDRASTLDIFRPKG